MCSNAEDFEREFLSSLMNSVIDKYSNAITLYVTVPPPPAKPSRNPDGTLKPAHPVTNGPQQRFEDNFIEGESSPEKQVSDSGQTTVDSECSEGSSATAQAGVSEALKEDGPDMATDGDGREEEAEVKDKAVSVDACVESSNQREDVSGSENSERENGVLGTMEDANRPLQRSE